MTAEIGILNRHGVALATDSAVTIGGQKVFNSANKLFALSKFHPVGIMIYGNGSFMGVPWDTIIKSYRKQLKNDRMEYLELYADDFIRYLFSNEAFFSSESEKGYVRRNFYSRYNNLLDKANEEIYELFKERAPQDNERFDILVKAIDSELKKLKETDNLIGFDKEFIDDFISNYSETILNIVIHTTEIDLTDEIKAKILELAVLYFMKDTFFNQTGVVIAGFGEKDIFPRLYQYDVEGKILKKNKYKLRKVTKIGAENTEDETIVTISPFAQQEMVHLFIAGIHPYINHKIFSLINEFTSQLSHIIKQILNQISPDIELNSDDEEGINQLGTQILNAIRSKFEEFKDDKHVQPLLDAVANLPKEELAALAEALINLTSIKRKMTIDIETVGGPIDVAVITKGDGFVWIKRKHYFQPELNHGFFKNYLWGDESGKCNFYD